MKDTKKWIVLLAMVSALSWNSMGLSLAGSSHEGHGDMSESHSGTMEHGAEGDLGEVLRRGCPQGGRVATEAVLARRTGIGNPSQAHSAEL